MIHPYRPAYKSIVSEISDPRQGKASGSSFDRLVACPGSLALINSLPRETVSRTGNDADAERGIRLHKAWKKEDPAGLTAEEFDDYEEGRKCISDLLLSWQMDTGVCDVKELPREHRQWFNHNLQPILSGEMDRRYLGTLPSSGTRAMLILDTKSGWLTYVPPASQSWQLRCYAVIANYNHGLTKVRVAFVKPKSKSEPIDYCDYNLQDILDSELSIRFHIWESEQGNAPRHPGRHCRFCPAKADCPEAAAYSLLPSVLAKGNGNGKLDIAERVNAMTPADLVRVFDAMPIVIKIGEAVKQRLKSFSDEDLAALGLARGRGKQLDPIVQPKEAWARIQELVAMPDARLWELITMSKPDLIIALRVAIGMTADGAKAFVARELADFMEHKTSEPPLVRIAPREDNYDQG